MTLPPVRNLSDSLPIPASSSCARLSVLCGCRRGHSGRVRRARAGVRCSRAESPAPHPARFEPSRGSRVRSSWAGCLPSLPTSSLTKPIRRMAELSVFSLIGRPLPCRLGKTYSPRLVRVQFAQDFHGLSRQGHDVGRSGLGGGVSPLAGIQVDVRALAAPQFARPREQQGCQPQGCLDHRTAVIVPEGAQQGADLRPGR